MKPLIWIVSVALLGPAIIGLAAEDSAGEEAVVTQEQQKKPGFWQRLKAGVTNQEVENQAAEPVVEAVEEAVDETAAEAPAPEAKKPGFWQRLRSGVGGRSEEAEPEPMEEAPAVVVEETPEPIAEPEVEAEPLPSQVPVAEQGEKKGMWKRFTSIFSREESEEVEAEAPVEPEPLVEAVPEPVIEEPPMEVAEPEMEAPAPAERKRGFWQRLKSGVTNREEDRGERKPVIVEPEPVVVEESPMVDSTADEFEVGKRAVSQPAPRRAEATPSDIARSSKDNKGFWSGIAGIWPSGPREELPMKELTYQALGDEASRFVEEADQPGGSVLLSEYTLDLEDYLKLVALNNDRIQYQRMEWAIAKSGAEGARGMYDPELTATYRYTDSLTPNTTEEEFRRSFAPVFDEKNSDYTFGIEGMVFTGGKLKLAYTYRQIDNNIQPAPIRGEEDKTYMGLSMTQPILRGAGGRGVVEAPITVATKEQEIALQTFRQAQFQMLSNAAISFWDTYVAERRVMMRQRSVEIAQTVLRDEEERLRFGRSSETRVASADAAVAQRQVQLFAAEQEVVQARADMRTFVAGLPDDAKLDIDTNVRLVTSANVPDRMQALEQAFQFRPEYIASKIRAEKEEVRIKFAKNNRLPQLDLVASYGINGLSDSFSESWGDAWSKDYETMYAGFEFKMLLGGNKRARSELTAAQLRKHQALLEIRAAEVSIHTSVDTALHNLSTALKQVRAMEGIVRTNERLLDVEMSRYQAGQSNSREVLEIEERLNEARETYIESQANLQKAMIGLSLAEGTLLRNYDLES